jgi:hypothetical protein
VCRCLSGCIEEVSLRVVVAAAVWLGRAIILGHLALPPSSLVATQCVRARDEFATLRPNCRPVLVVGGTRVPQVEFVCCRVGGDDDLMAVWLSRAALRLRSGPAARAGRQLVRLHGMGNRPPRVVVEVFVPRDRATWCGLCLGRRRRLLVRTSSLSCEAETCRRGSSSGELVREAPN